MIRIVSVLVMALFSVIFTNAVLAQSSSPQPSMLNGSAIAAMQHQMQQMPGAPPTADLHIEGELAYLKAEIKITDAQSKKWDVFADGVRQSIKNMEGITAQQQTGGLNKGFLENMMLREQYLKTRTSNLSSLLDKLKPLYDSLTPEQKSDADHLLPMHLAVVL